jgi:antitoxin ParD1/3/4
LAGSITTQIARRKPGDFMRAISTGLGQSLVQIDIIGAREKNNDMPSRTNLNVSLTPALDRFVQERVSTGRYQSASEVIRDGLRLLEQQERENKLALKSLKAKVARGAAQAERGEFVDPDEILQEIEVIKRKRAARKR